MIGIDGLALGVGYGERRGLEQMHAGTNPGGDDEHMTAFANYSMGPVTFGYQVSNIDKGGAAAVDQEVAAWGLAFNINENLSVSYGERDVTFLNPSATDVEESRRRYRYSLHYGFNENCWKQKRSF